jgi:DNA-binding response OmpR family regulator
MCEPRRRSHILVVEDDRDLRESLIEALEEAGYSVASAQDGQHALFYLRTSKRPDLILLDLQMPIMNGVEFRLEQLKSPELAAIPVAVLTADPDGRQKVAALQTAAFLKKPLNLPELFAMVARVVDRASRLDEGGAP